MKERRQANQALNVFGQPLAPGGLDRVTGFYRDGCCNTDYDDVGIHVVCVRVTHEFLEFSKKRGDARGSARRRAARRSQAARHRPELKTRD